MASQNEVLSVIKETPEGVTLNQLADHFKVKSFALTKVLSDLKKKGQITHDGELYRVTGGVEAAPGEPNIGTLPSDFGEFESIGRSIGITGDFLRSISTFVFRGDPYNIDSVYESLKGLHLRPDTTARWTSMWAAAIGKPMSPKVAEATTPGAGVTTPPAPRRFSIIGMDILPDPEGDYSLTEALRILETRKGQSGDSDIKSELKELASSIARMREERYESLLVGQQQQLDKLSQVIGGMEGRLDRGLSGKTEMDILDKIATGALTEAQGLRGDIKGFLQSQPFPQPKSPEQIAQRKERYQQGLETDQKIEALGKNLFFGEPLPADLAHIGRPAPPPAPQVYE